MNLIKTFLAIGIAVIFTVFIAYGLYVVYSPPKYSYDESQNTCYKTYNCNQQFEDCQKQYNYSEQGYENCYSTIQKSTAYKTCLELMDKCNKDYQKTTPIYKYYRNSFFILTIIGIAAIITGLFLASLEGIGSGFLGGGILIILWSLIYTRIYWITFNKYLKLAVLGIVLVILIFFGYKKLEKKFKAQA